MNKESSTELKPFYISGVNIYDFEDEGFSRWNTFQAAETQTYRQACSSVELFKELIPGLAS